MSKTFKNYVYELVSEALSGLKTSESSFDETLKEVFDKCYDSDVRLGMSETVEKEFGSILEQYEEFLGAVQSGGVPSRWSTGETLKSAIYLPKETLDDVHSKARQVFLVEEFVEKALIMAEEDVKAMKKYL